MPFYRIETTEQKLHPINPSDFTSEQFLERQHLQPLLRDNPGVIDSGLLVIAEEFSNWEDSKRRIDLLGLDEDGNLVVIELKRVEEGGHMELQALRYAAMISAMNFEAVVNTYENFLNKLKKDNTNARSKIREFLEVPDGEEGFISNTPKIILIAPSFSQEITTTVIWLNERGLDIRCIKVNIYNIDDSKFLDIEPLIPLPSVADYQIKIREKTNQAVKEASTKQRRAKTINILVDSGILQEGTRVYLKRSPKPELGIDKIDEKAKLATFNKTSREFIWDFDNESYSLSSLCKIICENYNVNIGAGAFPGPDYWAVIGQEKSLSELAKELGGVDLCPVNI